MTEEDLARYQTKSTTPVDEYVCTLSDELKKLAVSEVRETEKIRKHALKAIREWVMENPRIVKCRLDSMFLLKMLRFKKYSIPMTQESIERYLIYREGLYGYDWLSNIDPLRPGVLTLLEKGLITPLPHRDKNGRKVIFIKMSALDLDMPDVGNCALALLTLVMEVLIDNEENQIRGINYIADLTGAHLKQVLIFPIDVWFKFGKNSEKACAIRHKGFNLINLPNSIQFLISFAFKHMPQKLRDRVKFYDNSHIADIDVIDRKYLPKEYGGEIPLADIIDEWKQILIDKREWFSNFGNMKINRNSYPKEVLMCEPEFLKTPLNSMDLTKSSNQDDNLRGVQGSFRKLEID